MSVRDDKLRERLQAAGQKLAAADRDRQKAMGAIQRALRAGQARFTVAELSRLTGVSRVTVYELLKDKPED